MKDGLLQDVARVDAVHVLLHLGDIEVFCELLARTLLEELELVLDEVGVPSQLREERARTIGMAANVLLEPNKNKKRAQTC